MVLGRVSFMERGIQICAALGKGAGGDVSEIGGSLAGRQLQSSSSENNELMVEMSPQLM